MTDAPEDVIYRHGTYAPLVGSAFEIHRPDGRSVPFELVEAAQLPGRGECFSLVFRGPGEVPLDQRAYRVEHPTIGAFSLFLVPLGPSNGSQQLEAVVNRLEA
jgi:hypothetical protein